MRAVSFLHIMEIIDFPYFFLKKQDFDLQFSDSFSIMDKFQYKLKNKTIDIIIFGEMKSMIPFMPEKCQHPAYNGKNLTNRVLVQSYDSSNSITYYCPAYIRLKVKNMVDMKFDDLGAAINAILSLTINFRGISHIIASKIRKMLKLSFNRDQALKIQEDSVSIRLKTEESGVYTYNILRTFNVALKTDIFYSPFEVLYLILSINLQNIQINQQDISQMVTQVQQQISRLLDSNQQPSMTREQKMANKYIIDKYERDLKELESLQTIYIKFNFMDTDYQGIKLIYTDEGAFGNYDLARNMLKVQYSEKSISSWVRSKKMEKLDDEENKQKIDYSAVKPFNYAHFQIPIYKFPFVPLLTVFLPLWLLGVINMAIFLEDNGLGDRIANLSALLIAFVALIPVIREQIPPSPKITLVEWLVYLQAYTTLICFIQSVNIRDNSDYQFDLNDNPYFIVCLAIGVAQVVLIFFLFILHKLKWEKSYRMNEVIPLVKFNYLKWCNKDCDRVFRRKLDNRKIQVVQVDEEEQKMNEHLSKVEEEKLKVQEMKQI